MSLKKICLWVTLVMVVVALVALPALAQGTKAPVKKEAPKVEKAPPVEKAAAKAKTEAQTPPQKGMVWVNTDSKVYHKEGSRFYGKTKIGKWMTEDEVKKAGFKEAAAAAGLKKGVAAKKEEAVKPVSAKKEEAAKPAAAKKEAKKP